MMKFHFSEERKNKNKNFFNKITFPIGKEKIQEYDEIRTFLCACNHKYPIRMLKTKGFIKFNSLEWLHFLLDHNFEIFVSFNNTTYTIKIKHKLFHIEAEVVEANFAVYGFRKVYVLFSKNLIEFIKEKERNLELQQKFS